MKGEVPLSRTTAMEWLIGSFAKLAKSAPRASPAWRRSLAYFFNHTPVDRLHEWGLQLLPQRASDPIEEIYALHDTGSHGRNDFAGRAVPRSHRLLILARPVFRAA